MFICTFHYTSAPQEAFNVTRRHIKVNLAENEIPRMCDAAVVTSVSKPKYYLIMA